MIRTDGHSEQTPSSNILSAARQARLEKGGDKLNGLNRYNSAILKTLLAKAVGKELARINKQSNRNQTAVVNKQMDYKKKKSSIVTGKGWKRRGASVLCTARRRGLFLTSEETAQPDEYRSRFERSKLLLSADNKTLFEQLIVIHSHTASQ